MSREADMRQCAYEQGYERGKQDAVKHGRWDADPCGWHCNQCGADGRDAWGFCQNCGAKMDAQEGAELN